MLLLNSHTILGDFDLKKKKKRGGGMICLQLICVNVMNFRWVHGKILSFLDL